MLLLLGFRDYLRFTFLLIISSSFLLPFSFSVFVALIIIPPSLSLIKKDEKSYKNVWIDTSNLPWTVNSTCCSEISTNSMHWHFYLFCTDIFKDILMLIQCIFVAFFQAIYYSLIWWFHYFWLSSKCLFHYENRDFVRFIHVFCCLNISSLLIFLHSFIFLYILCFPFSAVHEMNMIVIVLPLYMEAANFNGS